MKTIYETEIAGFTLSLVRHGSSKKYFDVVYGKQVTRGLTYTEAAKEFGLCLMHGLTCEGKLDYREA